MTPTSGLSLRRVATGAALALFMSAPVLAGTIAEQVLPPHQPASTSPTATSPDNTAISYSANHGTTPTPSPSPSPSPAATPATSSHGTSQVASSNLTDAALLAKIQAVPHGIWATGGDPAAAVQAALSGGPLASLVIYDIPGRDCGNYSAGGAPSDDAYRAYIQAIANAIAGRSIRVILEPDALALGCTQTSLFADTPDHLGAVTILKRAGAQIYLDAAHSGWLSVSAMTAKLLAANIQAADGFALNVSNFDTTATEISYGNQLSTLTGGKHFVIDTSRNGNGSNGEWCNPSGRALGTYPTTATGTKLVDAYLWLKVPGESDGTCNGGPSAGVWWPSSAISLGRAAGW